MDLLSAQKNTHDYVVYSFKKYWPAGGRSETLYQSGWFEEMYTFAHCYLLKFSLKKKSKIAKEAYKSLYLFSK